MESTKRCFLHKYTSSACIHCQFPTNFGAPANNLLTVLHRECTVNLIYTFISSMHTKQVSKHNKPEHNGQWFTRLNSEAIRIEKKKKAKFAPLYTACNHERATGTPQLQGIGHNTVDKSLTGQLVEHGATQHSTRKYDKKKLTFMASVQRCSCKLLQSQQV